MRVPVAIEGKPKTMLVDTGASATAVDPRTASELNLITHRLFEGTFFTASGQQFQEMAVIRALDIGQSRIGNVRVLVWPSPMSTDPDMAGTLGADFLRNYDIDLNLPEHKLGVFSQDHCPGKVVYWPADAVAVVPIHVVNSGHIIVPIKLDGHPFSALLDTGASNTLLTLEAAQNFFGLGPNSPDMTRSGEFGGGNPVPVYKHTFKTLELEGITMNNPTVFIWEDIKKYGLSQASQTGTRLNDAANSEWVTDVTLGFHQLRNLHIYIAYKEQKMYVTAGSPAPAGAPVPTGATPATTP